VVLVAARASLAADGFQGGVEDRQLIRLRYPDPSPNLHALQPVSVRRLQSWPLRRRRRKQPGYGYYSGDAPVYYGGYRPAYYGGYGHPYYGGYGYNRFKNWGG
jgi:hypothetical protein